MPVLASGEPDTPWKALEILDYTKCDGLLIGRARRGGTWIFREIAYFLCDRNGTGAADYGAK